MRFISAEINGQQILAGEARLVDSTLEYSRFGLEAGRESVCNHYLPSSGVNG
jgi:hypothetical protein